MHLRGLRTAGPSLFRREYPPAPLTWEPELEELRPREGLARGMGGGEGGERQHAPRRLTGGGRVGGPFDEGTFHETGAIAGQARYEDGELAEFLPANMLVGQGRIEGRRAVVQGDDFTVRGGAADAAIWQKMVYAERMAHDLRLPLVRLVDGTGGGGSGKSLETMGFTYVPLVPGWRPTVENLSRVPVATAALRPVAVGRRYGASLVVALARLGGRPVGVMASDPRFYAGGLTAEASDKLTRFVDMCDQFRLPVVNFVDQPGFVIGTEAERRGTIRRGTRALTAVYQASVPWASVLVRKAFGVAGGRPHKCAAVHVRHAAP